PLVIYRHVGVGDALDVAQTIFAELGPVLEGADLIFVDVDGDGERDLVTPTDAGLYLVQALGDGSFADPPQVLAHDFVGDYPRRLVALGPKGDPIFVLGDEPYDNPPAAALLIPDEGLTSLTTELLEDPGRIVGSADFDGDGQPDLAVLHGSVPAQLGLWLSGG
ncbi:MAG: hypothetical protein KC457_22155, partial [Myxococcales bacterium]|nr:hypothetical protein [Myxococcales bacterium]